MKARFTIFAFLFLCLTGLNAQTGFLNGSVVPLKPQSPLFGKDIKINDLPTENQRNVAVCCAFNGWLYAAYWVKTAGYMELTIMKSVDDGMTWDIFRTVQTGVPSEIFTSFKIATCGNSLSTLKVFMGLVYYDTIYHTGTALVPRLDGITGVTEADVLQDQFVDSHYLDISTDFNYPASNSDPGSFAILYSKHQGLTDSLIFYSSSNGGMTLNNHKVVSKSSDQFQFRRVALNYGRSSSYSDGQYFAAWELKSVNNSDFDHIYTAHSEPSITGPFTSPVCLDSLDASLINKVRNPIIACQYNNVDNDSANLTEVVLFEKYHSSGGDYDVTGYYNLQAATTSHFSPLNIATSFNNELQPDICFNTYNSKFMVTYFDSTNKKLPFLTNDVNLANPNSWNVVSQGYNDNNNLVAPYPKVDLNIVQQDGMNAWISAGTGGNGIALFDAPYSTYTGVSENNIGTSAKLIGSYPNPCSNKIKISFELKNAGKVTINLMGIMGQPLGTVTDQIYSAGKNAVQYDVSGLPSGSYFYTVRSGEFSAAGKFTVVR
jgi:Secretion system C-terminal sorting domain